MLEILSEEKDISARMSERRARQKKDIIKLLSKVTPYNS